MTKPIELGLAVIGIAEQLYPRFRGSSDKSPNDVYVGTVLLPHGDLRVRAYIKVFLPKDRGQLVFNEVIAHHLAKQCGLPSPHTFPCICRPSQLRSATRAMMIADGSSDFVMGVASVDCARQEVRQSFAASEMVVAEVTSWPEVARWAVFDELVGNDDRNLGNLVRRGPRDYMAIDHERLLFGEPWFQIPLQSLQSRRCDPNILANTIAEGADPSIGQQMLRVARDWMLKTVLSTPLAADVLERRRHAPEGITSELVDMLNVRRGKLPFLMQWHLRKGDLFRATMK